MSGPKDLTSQGYTLELIDLDLDNSMITHKSENGKVGFASGGNTQPSGKWMHNSQGSKVQAIRILGPALIREAGPR